MIPLWSVEPAAELLSGRDANEAYVAADKGESYAVYLPVGGEVKLDLSAAKRSFTVHWININTGEFGAQEKITGGSSVKLSAPSSDNWAAAIVFS